jgi:hypothetical protein
MAEYDYRPVMENLAGRRFMANPSLLAGAAMVIKEMGFTPDEKRILMDEVINLGKNYLDLPIPLEGKRQIDECLGLAKVFNGKGQFAPAMDQLSRIGIYLNENPDARALLNNIGKPEIRGYLNP